MTVRLNLPTLVMAACTISLAQTLPAQAEPAAPVPSQVAKSIKAFMKAHKNGDPIAFLEQTYPSAKPSADKNYLDARVHEAAFWFRKSNEKQWRRQVDLGLRQSPHYLPLQAAKIRFLLYSPGKEHFKEAEQILNSIDRRGLSQADLEIILYLQAAVDEMIGRYPQMLATAQQLCNLNPTFVNQRLVAAALYYNARYKDSADQYLRLFAQDKSNPEPLLRAAHMLIFAKEYTRSLALCRRVSSQYKLNTNLRITLGDILYAGRPVAEAVKRAEAVWLSINDSECNPEQLSIKYSSLTNCAQQPHATQRGLNFALKAAAAVPSLANKKQVASCYRFLGQYANAIVWYKQVTEMSPNEAEPWYLMAICTARLGDVDSGIKLATKALAVHPESVQALRLRGGFYCAQGRLRDASSDLERLQKLDPGHQYTLQSLQSTGGPYYKDVVNYFRQVSAGFSQHDDAHLKKLSDAIAAEKDPQKNNQLLLARAELEMQLAMYKQVIADAESVIATGSNSYRPHALKAGALFALKRLPEAAAERELAVAANHNEHVLSKSQARGERLQ